jgi:hypothetical protein
MIEFVQWILFIWIVICLSVPSMVQIWIEQRRSK